MSFDSPRDAIYITHTKSTCFSIQVPSSGCYYNKGLCANLLICFFVIISFITLVVKIHKMCKHTKIYIVNNLWCFDNKLIISRLNSQLLASVFQCYILMNHLTGCFRVIYTGTVYKLRALLVWLFLSRPVIIYTNLSKFYRRRYLHIHNTVNLSHWYIFIAY
jgi:hypothetical protein